MVLVPSKRAPSPFTLSDLESLPKLTEIKSLVAGEEPPAAILEEERQEQAFGNEENTGDKDNQSGEKTRSTSET